MKKQRFNFKLFAIAQAILIPIATFPMWFLKLFSPATAYCVDIRDNEVVKLYDGDCHKPGQLTFKAR